MPSLPAAYKSRWLNPDNSPLRDSAPKYQGFPYFFAFRSLVNERARSLRENEKTG